MKITMNSSSKNMLSTSVILNFQNGIYKVIASQEIDLISKNNIFVSRDGPFIVGFEKTPKLDLKTINYSPKIGKHIVFLNETGGATLSRPIRAIEELTEEEFSNLNLQKINSNQLISGLDYDLSYMLINSLSCKYI
jgi:hypothetical protein